jgi:hypothetical protein
VEGYSETHPFSIEMDPNLKGVTEEDLQEQFDLSQKIVQKTSAANEAVIRIREIRNHLQEHKDQIPDRSYKRTVQPFLDQLAGIEQELYQVKNQSNQDPLNFPIKLNNRLASLRRSIENGDAKPTDGAYKVFSELSEELDQHLRDLGNVLEYDGPGVKRVLQESGLPPLPEASK